MMLPQMTGRLTKGNGYFRPIPSTRPSPPRGTGPTSFGSSPRPTGAPPPTFCRMNTEGDAGRIVLRFAPFSSASRRYNLLCSPQIFTHFLFPIAPFLSFRHIRRPRLARCWFRSEASQNPANQVGLLCGFEDSKLGTVRPSRDPSAFGLRGLNLARGGFAPRCIPQEGARERPQRPKPPGPQPVPFAASPAAPEVRLCRTP